MNTPARPGPLRGLYAITSAQLCADRVRLLQAVAAALRGGAALVQLRDKHGAPQERRAKARALSALCHDHAARLIVNDDVELALDCGADGVHLGAADPPLAQARAALGPSAILGASCGPSLERARAAVAAGADYVAFGRFFPSRTKPEAPQAEPALLAQGRGQIRVPVCVIGGLTPDNAGALVAAGADLVAAVEGVFGDGEPAAVETAARAYARLFEGF
jgi:thiamine-phosphate pyrophosphorylase